MSFPEWMAQSAVLLLLQFTYFEYSVIPSFSVKLSLLCMPYPGMGPLV